MSDLATEQHAHVKSIIADMAHYRRPVPPNFVTDMHYHTGVPQEEIEGMLTQAGYEPVDPLALAGYRLPRLVPTALTWYDVRPIEFITYSHLAHIFVKRSPQTGQLYWVSAHPTDEDVLEFFADWFDGKGPDDNGRYRILVGSPHKGE